MITTHTVKFTKDERDIYMTVRNKKEKKHSHKYAYLNSISLVTAGIKNQRRSMPP